MVAVGERLLRRRDDVLGRREVRLADAEIDDAAARLGQPLRPGEHLEGALGAEAVHPLRKLHGARVLSRFDRGRPTIARAAALASGAARTAPAVAIPPEGAIFPVASGTQGPCARFYIRLRHRLIGNRHGHTCSALAPGGKPLTRNPAAPTISPTAMLVGMVIVVGALYVGSEILIPLALAILLSFMLAPIVIRLRRWRLGRIPSVLLVVLLVFTALLGLGSIVGDPDRGSGRRTCRATSGTCVPRSVT